MLTSQLPSSPVLSTTPGGGPPFNRVSVSPRDVNRGSRFRCVAAVLRRQDVSLKEKRAQPVENRTAFVDLDAAERVRPVAGHDVRTGVDDVVKQHGQKVGRVVRVSLAGFASGPSCAWIVKITRSASFLALRTSFKISK